MNDLQDLFESIGYNEVKRLASMVDKKSLNNKSIRLILDYVSTVYCAEKNVESADVTQNELDKLIEDFYLFATLYLSVLEGHMEIKSGRLKLTDGDDCTFSLTSKGKSYVENDLLPKINIKPKNNK